MTTKTELYRLIRENCVDCCGGSTKEVELCPIKTCPLFLHRFGKDPAPAKGGKWHGKKIKGNTQVDLNSNGED